MLQLFILVFFFPLFSLRGWVFVWIFFVVVVWGLLFVLLSVVVLLLVLVFFFLFPEKGRGKILGVTCSYWICGFLGVILVYLG